MIVKVEFVIDNPRSVGRDPAEDKVILAIDKAMNGATWEKCENGWKVMK
jgi:hypothetical protein|tara:strand:- start:883 stop:1029 length:147 start_codon:yes stop_codon:yes gene_type:complete